MTTGVWPDSMVAGVGSTGRKLPASLSRRKKSTPGAMSSTEPPLAIAAISTPLAAALAVVGSPLSATLPLNSGLSRSLTRGDLRNLGRVVADGHVAAVVVDPGAVRILELRGDVVEGRDLVRREHAVFASAIACPRSKTSGAVLLPFCWLAALISSWLLASGWAEFTLMPYFAGERVDDLLVVGPIRRQRNHIELTLGLARP